MSFFVWSLYRSKAALKIVSKSVEEVAVGRAWDIMVAIGKIAVGGGDMALIRATVRSTSNGGAIG
jgi:hypothetical protein